MSGFLHSLPWTIALALAQAGEDTRAPDLSELMQAHSVSELSAPEAEQTSSSATLSEDEQRDESV